jgi:hypothetical protein
VTGLYLYRKGLERKFAPSFIDEKQFLGPNKASINSAYPLSEMTASVTLYGEWISNRSFCPLIIFTGNMCKIQMMMIRRMKWAGHVACMGEVFIGFWLGGRKVRDHWEDLGGII